MSYYYNLTDTVCYVYLVYNIWSGNELSISVCLKLLWDIPDEVYFKLLYSDQQQIPIYYVTLLIITTLYLSHKFWINFSVLFYTIIVCFTQVHLWPPNRFNCQEKASTERRGYIRGRLVVVREIMTFWLQWLLGNTLL